MRSNIETYFSQPRHHASESAKQCKLQARKFIESEFRRLGLETEVQMFQDAGYPDVQFYNVIGVLKGERFGSIEDKILGVGAHYDTYPIYNTPGVDDNGAGVAAMLDVLRQVAKANKAGTKRQNTIIFASFDAEELEYLGGYALTRNWLQPYVERNYGAGANTKMREHGVIIMDTMMNFVTDKKSQSIPPDYVHEANMARGDHEGDFLLLTYREPSRDKDLATKMREHGVIIMDTTMNFVTDKKSQSIPPDYVHEANMARDDHEGDFLLLTYREPSRDKDLATSFKAAWNGVGSPEYELESFPLPIDDYAEIEKIPAFGPFRRSDHRAFWSDNIPAIFISDTADFRGDMKNCYHQDCDNIETMLQDDNLKFLGKTVDAIVSTYETLSEASAGGSNGGENAGGDNVGGDNTGGDSAGVNDGSTGGTQYWQL